MPSYLILNIKRHDILCYQWNNFYYIKNHKQLCAAQCSAVQSNVH